MTARPNASVGRTEMITEYELYSDPREASIPGGELKADIMVLTGGSRPVAAIVPLKGVDGESLALSAHLEFLDVIARSRAQFASGETLLLDQMKRAVLTKRKTRKRVAPRTL